VARVSHEFFDQSATSYGMEKSLISLFWNSSIPSSFVSYFSCVCLVENPNTGEDTWDRWQQQWLGSSNIFSRPFVDAWWQRGRRSGLKQCVHLLV
jgi:hypothetical protein